MQTGWVSVDGHWYYMDKCYKEAKTVRGTAASALKDQKWLAEDYDIDAMTKVPRKVCRLSTQMQTERFMKIPLIRKKQEIKLQNSCHRRKQLWQQ